MSVPNSIQKAARTVVSERDASRPRAIWRILTPLLAVLIAGSVGSVLAYSVIGGVSDELFVLFQDVLFTVLTLAVLVVSARWLDHRKIAEYGFEFDRTWITEFVLGSILGIAANLLVLVVAFGLGWATITDWISSGATLGFATGFVIFFIAYLLTGFWEETLFRGILITNIGEGLAARRISERTTLFGTIGVSTALFAVIHLNQVTSIEVLPYMLTVWVLMGGLFALVYLATGSLALPIGLHFTFNFSANNVFGLPGEHGTAIPSLLRLDITAPEIVVPVEGMLGQSILHIGSILLLYVWLAVWMKREGLSLETNG